MENEIILTVSDMEVRPKFIAAMIDWYGLTRKTKNKLLKAFLNKELDYPDQWYYMAVIIPVMDGCADYDRAVIFLDEFPPIRGGYVETAIAEYINDPNAESAVACHCCPCGSVTAKTKIVGMPI